MLITKHEEVTKQGFSKIHGRLFEVGANSRLGAYSNKYGIDVYQAVNYES